MGILLCVPLLFGVISACSTQSVATTQTTADQPVGDDDQAEENYVDASAIKARRQKLKQAILSRQKQRIENGEPKNSVTSSITLLSSKTETPADKPTHILQAPLIAQMPELPRGCEVTTLAMLLQYEGVKVGKMELAKKIDKVPFLINGKHGNPHDGFVGDMYTFKEPGIGVFHDPIARLAKKYLGNRIHDLTGSTWSAVEKQIDKGQPVWVIVTSKFKWLPASYWRTWQTEHGPVKITYKEHAVLITGYSNHNVYFNDPLANIKNRRWNKSDFVAGWRQFGSQAISYN